MAALATGVIAPDFTLPTLEGKPFSLAAALKKGPVLLAFFKTSCPVCQYAFPFFERVYQANRGQDVSALGVSQDSLKQTQGFLKDYGVSFPVAIDDEKNRYAVSNAYGLTNVPTIFLIAPGGEIEATSVGWSKADVEEINRRLAQYRKQQPAPLWRKGEEVQDFRAG